MQKEHSRSKFLEGAVAITLGVLVCLIGLTVIGQLFGCSNPSYPAIDLVSEQENSFPEYDSTNQAYNLDSLFDYLNESEGEDVQEDTSFVEIEDDGYWDNTDEEPDEVVEGVVVTQKNFIPSVKAETLQLDTLNQVLGVSDLILVWKGDTCTTNYMEDFLQMYDASTDIANIKPHFLAKTLQHLLMGDATDAVQVGDLYLKEVMYGVGLDEYVRFYNFKKQTPCQN